jgi:hypothetical protein
MGGHHVAVHECFASVAVAAEKYLDSRCVLGILSAVRHFALHRLLTCPTVSIA